MNVSIREVQEDIKEEELKNLKLEVDNVDKDELDESITMLQTK